MYFKCGSKEICFQVAFLKLIHLHVSDAVETATSIETTTSLKCQDRDFIKISGTGTRHLKFETKT